MLTDSLKKVCNVGVGISVDGESSHLCELEEVTYWTSLHETVKTHLATVFIYFSCNGVEIVYVASNESDPVAVLGEKSTKKEMAFQQAVDMQTVLLEVRLRCRSTSTCQEQKK